MKRVLMFILAITTAASMVSCGGNGESGETKSDSTSAATSVETDATTDAATDAVTDAATDVVTDAATDTVTDAVTDAATDAATDVVTDAATDAATGGSDADFDYSGFIPGEHGEDAYVSEFTMVGFNIPNGWKYATQAELDDLVGITDDMTDLEIQELLAQMKVIYDAVVFSEDKTSNFMVTYERSTPAAIAQLDYDKTLDVIKTTLDTQYSSIGYTDTTCEKTTISFDGVDFKGIDYSANANGVSLYQRLFITTAGEYLATICITSVDKTVIENATNNFFILK